MKTELKKRRSSRIRDKISNSSSSNGTDHICRFLDCDDLILINILSRVPAKSLMRLKCVCKHWRSIIKQDPWLIKLHEANRCKDITTLLVYPAWPLSEREEPEHPLPGIVEIRSILFSQKDLMLDDGRKRISTNSRKKTHVTLYSSHNMILDARFNMLEPVHGLLCFVRPDEPNSVLICNPCTGEKTPWIETRTSEVFVSSFGQEQIASCRGNMRLCYDYLFGFGFDQTTKQHKVLCVCKIVLRRIINMRGQEYPMVVSHKVICRVLTVGENRRRKIEDHHFPLNTVQNEKSVYVNGSICWIHYQIPPEKNEVIVFDVGRETFRVIVLPDCIPEFLWNSYNTAKLVNVLVAVDGHLAVLYQKGVDLLNLSIFNDNDGGGGGDWISETIQMPCPWGALENLDFKDITGTDLTVIKFIKCGQTRRECLRYYNKKEKKYYKNQFECSLDITGPYVDEYQISPFCETLLPVQTVLHGEEIN